MLRISGTRYLTHSILSRGAIFHSRLVPTKTIHSHSQPNPTHNQFDTHRAFQHFTFTLAALLDNLLLIFAFFKKLKLRALVASIIICLFTTLIRSSLMVSRSFNRSRRIPNRFVEIDRVLILSCVVYVLNRYFTLINQIVYIVLYSIQLLKHFGCFYSTPWFTRF
jgi:hypothetical protein